MRDNYFQKVITSRLDVNGILIKGHVTIFNQEFKGKKHFRAGSSEDVDTLCSTFRKFGIEPTSKPDLKYKDIVKEMDICKTIKTLL